MECPSDSGAPVGGTGVRFVGLPHTGSGNRSPDEAEWVVAAILSHFAMGRAGRVSGTYEKVLPGLPYILAYEIVARPEGGEVVTVGERLARLGLPIGPGRPPRPSTRA